MKENNFIKSTLLIFFASILGNLFAYIFQLYSAHLLTVENYGLLNMAFSIIFPFLIVQTPLQNYITKELTTNNSLNFDNKNFFKFIKQKLIFLIFLYAFFASSITIFIGLYLGIPLKIIFIMILTYCFYIPNTIAIGIYQSYKDDLFLSLETIIPSFVKVFIGLIIACITKSVFAILVSLLISQIVYTLFFIYETKKYISNSKSFEREYYLKEAFFYMNKNVSIYLCQSLLMYLDVLLVKYYCTLHETGIYSLAAVLGKTVIYLPTALTLVLFPTVTENFVSGKSSSRLLVKSLLLNLFISGSIALILFYGSHFFIPLFFGKKYNEAIYIVKYLGIVFIPISMITILFTYFLAKQRFNCIFSMLVTIIVQLLLAYFYHENLFQLILTFFISGVIGCFGFFIQYLGMLYKSLRKKKINSK